MRAALRLIQGLILVGLISVLAAQAAGAEVGRITEGTLFWRTAEQSALVPAPRLKTDVRIVVTGIVARASVRQEFTDPRPSASSRSCSRPRLPPRSFARAALSIEQFETRLARPLGRGGTRRGRHVGAGSRHVDSRQGPARAVPLAAGLGAHARWRIRRKAVAVGRHLAGREASGAGPQRRPHRPRRRERPHPGLRSRLRTGKRGHRRARHAIVTAHRDTHFRFLERVRPGDEIVVELPGRSPARFRVEELAVVDARSATISSPGRTRDRKSTRLNSSHTVISYAVFCLKKKNRERETADDS